MLKSKIDHLEHANPLLARLFLEVSKHTPIQVLDATRGKAAQELAFRRGFSTVHYGESAHNYSPAVAVDVVPLPLNWKNANAFVILGKQFVLPIAKKMGIKVRWGNDFNMNGDYNDDHFKDLPHWELFPWRNFVTKAMLVK